MIRNQTKLEVPMSGKWRTLIAVSIATFMLLLDVTVVNVALPEIQTQLGASFNDLRWVIDSYALTLAATMLIFGSISDRLGRRRLFTIGLAAFSTASLACGIAWDPLSLNVFRGLQGLGGAMMLSTSLALLAGAYSGKDRHLALGIWGATTAGAVALGPLIGGALVEAFGWEAIFFVNVPIGLVTAFLTIRGVPESRDPSAKGRPDFGGLVTLSAAMTMLVVALFRGNDEGWGSALIVGMLVGAAALLAAFVAIERRARQSLLDLSLFAKPTTSGASAAILLMAFSVFAMLTYLVFYIQNGLGYDPLETGLRLLPLSLASFFAGGATARLAQRLPARGLIAAGLATAGVGLLLIRNGVTLDSGWTALIPGTVVIGIGAGLANPGIAGAALGSAPVTKSGMASGLNSTFRLLGVAVGVAALGAIVESEVTGSLLQTLGAAPAGLVDVVSTGNIGAVVANAPAGTDPQALGDAATIAFVEGFDKIALVASLVAFAGAALGLALVRSRDIENSPEMSPEPAGEVGAAPVAA
jgi:EmrB/QacA subfamily drug resistance transporter